tara:strand:+ start:2238 stop:3446 length:1209 start_codon:yes stop_codon:yes gene_type:complete
VTAQRIAIAYDCLYPYTTGGGERQYRAFAEEMARRGRQVSYLTTVQWDSGSALPRDFDVIPVTNKLRLYGPSGSRSSLAAVRYAAGLFRALRRKSDAFDGIIVSGLPVLNVFAARAALLGKRKPIAVDYLEVWTKRQWVAYSGRVGGRVAWLLQRAALRLTPAATCHSKLSAARLRSEGYRGPILVSAGLISDDAEALPPQPESPPGDYVLYAGRHIDDKQVEQIPPAVALARKRVPALRLVITGDGPANTRVREAVEQADGKAWTTLPGFVPQDELNSLLSGALCLLNPSRREGYGLVVVEAARWGTPTILADAPDNASVELIDDGTNGFIAPSADPRELADAIVKVHAAGHGLRRRTREWYSEAVRTRTIGRTVENLLHALDNAHERSQQHRSTAKKGHS